MKKITGFIDDPLHAKKIDGFIENPFRIVQGPAGPVGPPGPAGPSGSSIAPNDPTNPSAVASGQMPATQGFLAGMGESFQTEFSSDLMVFSVLLQTSRKVMWCLTAREIDTVSSLLDPTNLLLQFDAGIGIFISKAVDSNFITVKNRLGSPEIILVQAWNSSLTNTTVWS
jgi:hypothetical protein